MPLLTKFIANQRYAMIAPHIRGDVLELGCGNAQVLAEHADKLTSYSGVERSPKQIEKLKGLYPDSTFYQRDLDKDQLNIDRQFDCILMIALIEHLFNQQFVMDQVAKLLKPGGVIVITTPTPIGNDFVHRLGASVGLFSKMAVDDHIVLYNRHRFRILVDEVGLKLKSHRYFQLMCNQLAVLERPAA